MKECSQKASLSDFRDLKAPVLPLLAHLVADFWRCEPKRFGGRGARAGFQKSLKAAQCLLQCVKWRDPRAGLGVRVQCAVLYCFLGMEEV